MAWVPPSYAAGVKSTVISTGTSPSRGTWTPPYESSKPIDMTAVFVPPTGGSQPIDKGVFVPPFEHHVIDWSAPFVPPQSK
jgi:hypothetical protein